MHPSAGCGRAVRELPDGVYRHTAYLDGECVHAASAAG